MFGFGKKKEYDVRLSESQLRELTQSMGKQERKAFEKKQKEFEKDREWESIMMAEVFWDDY